VADGSASLDSILKQFAGGMSAGPGDKPDASVPAGGGSAGGSGVKSTKAPADVPLSTNTDGWGGILDVYKGIGGMTPGEVSDATTGILKQVQGAYAPAIQNIEQGIGLRKAITQSPIARPVAPQLLGMPQAPDTRMKNPLNVFQNVGAVLALAGSLFTRRPMVTAMNAASAAIKGYAAGDKDAAERAHQSWKDNLEAAISQNQAEMDQYNTLLENTKLDYEERNAQLQAIAASNGDEIALAGLRAKGPEGLYDALQMRQSSASTLTQLLIQAKQHDEQMAMERERLSEGERHNQAVEALTAQRYGTGQTTLDPKTLDMLAMNFRKTGTMPPQGYGPQGAANRMAIENRAAEMGGNPDLATNKANYKAASGSLSNFTTYLNRVDTYQRTFLKNAQRVFQYADKGVGPTKIPVVDAWIQEGRRATGDPAVVAFDNAIVTAKNEYARIMSGANSNAQLQSGAMEKADGLFNSAMNLDQITAAFQVMQQDVTTAQQSTQEQIGDLQQRLSDIGQAPDATGGGDSHPYSATMPDNRPIYSDDGQSWFYDDGSPAQ